jgi:hypothetical protein
MTTRTLIASLAAAAALGVTAAPAAMAAPPAQTTPVCNEAENSFQGGYTVAPGVDPNPPAFLRGEQMRVGQGHGAGLVNAASHSPALAVCGDGGSTGGDGGSTGGDGGSTGGDGGSTGGDGGSGGGVVMPT